MTSLELKVLTPTLQTEMDLQTQAATDRCGEHAAPAPESCVLNAENAAWALTLWGQGEDCQHTQHLMTCGVLPPLVALLKNGGFQVQKENVWMMANFTAGTVDLLTHPGVLKPLGNVLTIHNTKIVSSSLPSSHNL